MLGFPWKFSFSPSKGIVVSLGLVFISLILLALSGFHLQNAQLICTNENSTTTYKAKLPLNGANLCPRGQLKFKAKIKDNFFPFKSLKVFSNSCITGLKVNETTLLDKEIQECETYTSGYEFNKNHESFHTEVNLEITLNEIKEQTVFYLSPLSNSGFNFSALFLAICLFGVSLFIFFLCRAFGLSVWISLIVFAGFWLRIFYLSHTNFAIREHDHGSHLVYIHYLLNYLSLPGPHINAATIHPPLYYVLVSGFYKLCNVFGLYEYSTFQFLSVLANIGFVIVSILIFQRLNLSANLKTLSALLIAFWPGLIINSVILNNDCLVALLYSLTFFFLLRWLQEDKVKFFFLACLFSFLTSFTKLVGIVILVLICVFTIWKIVDISKNLQRNLKSKFGLVVTLCFGLVPSVFITWFYTNFYSHNFVAYGYRQYFQELLHIPNLPKDFLTFNLIDFINCTYVNSYEASCGGQNVWIRLWKTSLWGEYGFAGEWNDYIGFFVGSMFALMVLFGLGRFLLSKKEELDKTFWLFTLNFLALSFSVAVSRVSHPVVSMVDFRYVLPILISFIYFFVTAYNKIKNSEYIIIKAAFWGSGSLLVLGSVCFILRVQ